MKKDYNVLRLENQICFPLYAASREITKLYKFLLDPLGLTYTQYITMLVIWEQKKISVKNLGERLFLDSGTLTPLLKKLESEGLIKRYRSSEDERVLIVEATVKGMRLRDKAVDIPEKINAGIGLSPDESVALYSSLYKIIENSEEK